MTDPENFGALVARSAKLRLRLKRRSLRVMCRRWRRLPRPAKAKVRLPAVVAECADAKIDLASLPSLESITATTDIRAFFTPAFRRS
jgi:hypothetical protein